MGNNKQASVALLKAMRGPKPKEPGLLIIRVNTTEPQPFTFVFEGGEQALDLDFFEIPVSLYPLRKGDRLLVFPLVGTENGQRWAAMEKLNGGVTFATMKSSSSLQIDGIPKTYTASDLVIGSDHPLAAGDLVALLPTLVGSKIKYVVVERY